MSSGSDSSQLTSSGKSSESNEDLKGIADGNKETFFKTTDNVRAGYGSEIGENYICIALDIPRNLRMVRIYDIGDSAKWGDLRQS